MFNPDAHTIYVHPDPHLAGDAKTLCFRVMNHIKLKTLKKFAVKKWVATGNNLVQPIMTYLNAEADRDSLTSCYANSTTFSIHERQGPRFLYHSGKLWTCQEPDCFAGYSARTKFKAKKHIHGKATYKIMLEQTCLFKTIP